MIDIGKDLEDVASGIYKATIAKARDSWVKQAQSKLGSSREEYIEAIGAPVDTSKTSGYIELKGTFPNMIEHGFGQFDMKVGFSKSPKKEEIVKDEKTGRITGWYLTIPLRHKTPGNGPSAMPRNIYKEAKKMDHGEQLSEILVRALGYGPEISHAGYKWQNSKYDNIQRSIKTYDSGYKRSTYTSFRRVSNKSNPRSWIHPGRKAANLTSQVTKETEEFFDDYVKDLVV